MMLSAQNVLSYLAAKGLLSPSTLVDSDVAVEELPHRNRNFRIRVGNDGGFFLKQASPMDPTGVETLRGEARAYRVLREEPLDAALRPRLPRLLFHDEPEHVIALELLAGRESLGEYHRREARFPAAVAARLGTSLADLHSASRAVVAREEVRGAFPGRIPWVLNAGNAESIPLHTQHGGSLQLVSIVQKYPEIRDQLNTLRSAWSPGVLIHGDVKWDNCLVARTQSGEIDDELHLVDWEMADIGDPAWDVGGALQAYITYWAFCLPATKGSTPADMVRAAPFRLESMHPAMRAFWNAYREGAALNGDSDAFLRRSVSFAAARAIQTAYESLYVSPQLTPQAVLLLQVSSNMLARAEEAIHELIGI